MATNSDHHDLHPGPLPIGDVLAELAAALRSRATAWRDRAALFVPGIRDWKNKANACEFIARELDSVAAEIETGLEP